MYEYQPPGPNDKRSPCPALNVLANHGYLPHDGQDITIKQYVDALYKGFNCSKPAGWGLIIASYMLLGVSFFKKLSLDKLGEHNKIEHDASLTRVDNFLGDQCVVNHELVDQLLLQKIESKITTESLAKLRLIRVKQSQEQNKEMVYGNIQKNLAYGESSLFLNFLNHLDVKTIEPFLKEETFPDGWTKPAQKVTISMLVNVFRDLKKRVQELEKSDPDKNLVVEENSKTKKTV